MRRIVTTIALSLSLAACGAEGGPLDPGAGPGQAQILIGRAPSVSASVAASMLAAGPPIDFSQISSLELVIDRVEAHRVGGGAWVSIVIDPVTVDLTAVTEGTATEVAAGGLPEGSYNQLRFFLQSATVTFLTDVGVGNAVFLAGQPYDIDIPSVDNTGLKVPTAHFTVGGTEETVVVLFDPTGTTASIGATGNGRVRMSPVLREADEATEAGMDDDGAEEGDEGTEEEEEEGSEEDGEGSEEGSGSGSASVLVGSLGGVSSSLVAGGLEGARLAGSVVPGGKISPADIISLRLAVCEIRAIRTGGTGDEDGAEEEEGAADETGEEATGGEETGESGEEADGDAEADETPACAGNAGGAAWTRIPLETTEIDLFALGEGEVVELGVGELPAGTYRNVRLYLSGAWITFARDMKLGNTDVVAGEEVALRIPSAQNSGLKIPSSRFEVVSDGEEAILLLFDQTSVSSIKATGQGLQMSPILREATPAEEAAADTEGDTSEGESEESG